VTLRNMVTGEQKAVLPRALAELLEKIA